MKCKLTMLKPGLCYYNNVYIYITRNLTIPRAWADAADQVANRGGKNKAFKNFGLSRNCTKNN